MNSRIAEMTDGDIATLVDTIDRTGFGVIPDFIGDDDLARVRDFVASAVRRSGGEYVGFSGPESVAGSGLDELSTDPAFRGLMERVYQRGTGLRPPRQDFYQLLRCLTGPSMNKHSYFFHYDSYVITVLIPIEVPASGPSGDFIMFPNTRPVRSRYIFNVLDKIILDNRVSQFILTTLTKRGWLSPVRIKMVPGNAYFFWGYRSVHTNEPCDPDKIRATALFHYVNPHVAFFNPAPVAPVAALETVGN
jgi:hypothetical protein